MSDLTKIGDYELLEKQNEGEWFDEYKARNRNTNEIVLMARVKNGLDVKGIESRFTRLKECSNEHLVRYIDVVKKDEELWIVMENCDCYSLAQFLRRKDFMTEEQLREIARGCLLGLSYLHTRGIMHGDMRPVNLFLTEDGVLKLGYYGLTTQAECYSIKKKECDGIRSFAPEVFKGKFKMKSDVWSFGTALLELMGIRPYYWFDNDRLHKMYFDLEPSFKEDTIKSSELADFLKKCFQRVSERWNVIELMDHPFVKECREEMLSPLVKILKYQEYCEWILKKDVKDAYLVLNKNGLCGYHEGLVEKFPSIVMELCLNGVIEVDIASHTLLRVNGEDVKGIEHNQVLDLSDDGERWEGDVLDNQPYGWGVLYDSENRRAYEGFRIGEVNVCYGTRYYSDIQKVEYKGEICEGKRWGRGIQYDRNGRTVYDGEWMNDEHLSKRVVLNEENQFLHNHIEELIVENNSCNAPEWTALDLGFIFHLRLFKVGDECFENVDEVKLIGLSKLERVVIGKKSFTMEKIHWPNCDASGHFYLKNCKRLRELKIGRYSFSDYSVCEIENLPSLKVIEMGGLNEASRNFRCASLELKNMPKLKSLQFGIDAFDNCSRAVFENLPELTSIRFGGGAFVFKDDDSNELIMRNLPKLTTLTTKGCNSNTFYYPRIITLEDMPSLTTVTLPQAFEQRYQLSYKNVGELANHPSIPKRNPHANIHSVDELRVMSQSVEVMIVDNNACNNKCFTALDLSFFSNLKVFEVGDYSFSFVEEVKLIGLNQLERVVIGENSFTKCKNDGGYDPNRRFSLKDCERLRELKIGRYSFSDYSVCEIENVPSLEVIEMGELNKKSYSFYYASLELKSDS
ncbi:hypothetical protein BLSTO_04390 [Blastocystis sp. subtype 1]